MNAHAPSLPPEPQAQRLAGAPAPPGATTWSAAARAALRGVPAAARRACFSKPALAGAAVSLALGLASTWLLGAVLKPPVAAGSHPPSQAMAAAYLMLLLLLSAAVALVPLTGGPGWRFGAAYARTLWWSVFGFAGVWLATGLPLGLTATLWTVTAAFVAVLVGAGSLLAWCFNGRRAVARPLLVAGLTLCVTGLLWSRPWLLSAYRLSPAGGSVATRGVLAGGPVTGMAAVWHAQGGGLDLIKGPLTYQVWIGSYHPPAYPALWPHEGQIRVPTDDGGFETQSRWMPGLVVALLSWGLFAMLLCDALGWLTLHDSAGRAPPA